MLPENGGFLGTFDRSLEAVGYSDSDAPVYVREWIPRETPTIVPVDADFPAITTELLQRSLGRLMARVEQVDYEVNLDGIGFWKLVESAGWQG